MSLLGTLNVGKTALATNQLALQTVGNNIANAGNENYARQITHLGNNAPQEIRSGLFVGTGVNVDSIERKVDESVEQRLRASVADSEGNASASQWMSRLEAAYNELSDDDLSTGMSAFFNAWSELANKPQDVGLRQVVIQNGETLANQAKSLRTQFNNLGGDLNDRVKAYTKDADVLAGKVANLNRQISTTEKGQGSANGLRDERDAVLKDLSKLVNFTVSNGNNGMVNLFVGSEPLVLDTTSRGLTLRNDTDAKTGEITQTLVFKDNGGTVPVTSGILGAAKGAASVIKGAVEGVDRLAGSLIYELNKIHTSGQGLQGSSKVTSDNAVADPDAALNTEKADLDFPPRNGSFVVHVKDKAIGAVTSTLVNVNLDGTGTQTTLNTLAASIDGVDEISARVTAGRMTVSADSDAVEISFSQDSSGALASLGIGGFFGGSNARDIAVKAELQKNPRLLAAAKNGQPADNQTAKLIADLQTRSIDALDGQSLTDVYQAQVNGVAARVAGARQDADAAQVVRDTLQSQRDSVSGVSLDDEAISLMRYQRAYQAASRVIATTDEMLQTILQLV